MCQMINVFIPVDRARAPEQVGALSLSGEGELHRGLRERIAGEAGSLFAVDTTGPCLCGFAEWGDLFALVRAAMEMNGVEWAAVLPFWSGNTVISTERELDPADEVGALVDEELVVCRTVPEDTRRHRVLVRTLAQSVGSKIAVRLKTAKRCAWC